QRHSFNVPKSLVIVLISGVGALAQSAQPEDGQAVGSKNIAIEGRRTTKDKPKLAVKARPIGARNADVKFHVVLLTSDGLESIAPENHSFKDGDRFRIQFELQEERYVYVLNRTMIGESEPKSKGVEIAPQPNVNVTPFKLVFPDKSGSGNRFDGHKLQL